MTRVIPLTIARHAYRFAAPLTIALIQGEGAVILYGDSSMRMDVSEDRTSYTMNESTQWARISTPFVGLFNDPVEIFVKKTGDGFLLSDDGETIRNLALSGVDINRSPRRRDWAENIRYNYGVEIDGDELMTKATASDLPEKKHNLICAIEDTISLEVTSRHNVSSLFKEDVRQMLDERDIVYTAAFPAIGSTGIRFVFDFQIATRTTETIIKTFGELNKMNVPSFLFAFDDVKDGRKRQTNKEVKGLAIVDDRDADPRQEYVKAILSKGVDLIPWSKRNLPEYANRITAS